MESTLTSKVTGTVSPQTGKLNESTIYRVPHQKWLQKSLEFYEIVFCLKKRDAFSEVDLRKISRQRNQYLIFMVPSLSEKIIEDAASRIIPKFVEIINTAEKNNQLCHNRNGYVNDYCVLAEFGSDTCKDRLTKKELLLFYLFLEFAVDYPPFLSYEHLNFVDVVT